MQAEGIAGRSRIESGSSEDTGRLAVERGGQEFVLLEVVALLRARGGARGALPADAAEGELLEQLLAERRAAQGMTVLSEQGMTEPKDG